MAGLKDQAVYSNGSEEEEEEEDYSEEEEDSDDDEEEDVRAKEPRKDAVYNTVGLHEKLEEIGWPDNIDWIEKLCVDYQREDGGEIDANDDLVREMAFYTQGLEGTREAFGKLQDLKMPFLRPPDYYAEMVKADSHMLKVKDKLLFQKQKIEEAEERKKAREAKKISKAVQAEKLKERAKQKKQDIEAVKKWRKMRQTSGFKEGRDEMPLDLEGGQGGIGFRKSKQMRPGVSPGDRSGGKGKSPAGKGNRGGNKRQFKNAKFGSGGPKRMRKQNTAESTADVSRFNKFGAKRKKSRQD
uniref:Uncharacterized protein n=1 Tax=Araucaria cunninghamii TaxID=56994 RepID=A0A0D6QRZ9_ARACU